MLDQHQIYGQIETNQTVGQPQWWECSLTWPNCLDCKFTSLTVYKINDITYLTINSWDTGDLSRKILTHSFLLLLLLLLISQQMWTNSEAKAQCAFHPANPGSSPKHIFYTFIFYSQICAIFVFGLWERTKRGRVWQQWRYHHCICLGWQCL